MWASLEKFSKTKFESSYPIIITEQFDVILYIRSRLDFIQFNVAFGLTEAERGSSPPPPQPPSYHQKHLVEKEQENENVLCREDEQLKKRKMSLLYRARKELSTGC